MEQEQQSQETTASNNKRIAKNTLFLYFRMLLIMGVSLYTSRVVLDSLGVEDFGLYNVVGGVVLMFAFINSAMSTATQRFLNYALGEKDMGQFRAVFLTSLNIHIFIAIILFVLAETLGLWFVNTQMTIPDNRLDAANWVYQASVLSCVFQIICIPYNATVISYEKMNIFSYISIIDIFLKLIIVLMLELFSYDRLKTYAILLLLETILVQFFYKVYCAKKFKQETRFILFWDKKTFRDMFFYVSWVMNGCLAVVAYTQGLNILLNVFFGPVVNAARGISIQVYGAVRSFCSNVQVAINPQLIKSYASGDLKYMHKLIIVSSKYSFCLLFLIALPILLKTEYILSLWLKEVPDHTIAFVRLSVVIAMINLLTNPLNTSVHATGKLKKFQLVEGTILLLIVPFSYLFLKLGFRPEVVFFVHIFAELLAQIARVVIVLPLIGFSMIVYLRDIVLRLVLFSAMSIVIPVFGNDFLQNDFLGFSTLCLISFFSVAIFCIMLIMNKEEYLYVKSRISFSLRK